MATSVRTFGGKTFRAGDRTWAHLDATVLRLKAKHPRARLQVIQGCYNTNVKASAGTHDYDAVLDVQIIGLTWLQAQTFLRWTGWAAWWRKPSQGFSGDHIHMISIPPTVPDNTPTPAQILTAWTKAGIRVGEYVPGQMDDYYAHALGLKGQHRAGSDPTPFPPDINATVYRPSPKRTAPKETALSELRSDWTNHRHIDWHNFDAVIRAGKQPAASAAKDTRDVIAAAMRVFFEEVD